MCPYINLFKHLAISVGLQLATGLLGIAHVQMLQNCDTNEIVNALSHQGRTVAFGERVLFVIPCL